MTQRNRKLQKVLSRRQFISLAGFGALVCTNTNPISMLLRGLVDGLISNAQAQVGIPEAKNYVSILFPGAPIRLSWDGFLNPNNESIAPNDSVANWLVADSYQTAPATSFSNTTYKSELVNLSNGGSIYLPPLWNRNMPTSTGGTVKMNSLLNNTMIMRGVHMLADSGHGVGPARVPFPSGAKASLSGLVGDRSNKPLAVVGLYGAANYADPISEGYKSLKGTSSTLVHAHSRGNNSLYNTMASFINDDPTVLANSNQLNSVPVQLAINNALAELGSFAKSNMPGSDVLYKNASNATKLFHTAFGNLDTIYKSLFDKYYNLAEACARTAIPNIIPTSGNGLYNRSAGNFTSEFAGQFAVAEYLLLNGYSSAISMCSESSAGVGGLYSSNDEHLDDQIGGRQMSVVSHSFQFLSLSAMIYELRRVLINANLWTRTVIHISAEYGRSPRHRDFNSNNPSNIVGTEPRGTDHGVDANNITVMSGAITQPIFIGNIKYESAPVAPDNPRGMYRGTWGVAAPVVTDRGTQMITNNIAAATVAAILGVESPISAAAPIVAVDSSGVGVTSLAEAPRNVA